MLTIDFSLSDINYENTLQQLFPGLSKRIQSAETDNLFIHLFQRLDETALPVMLSILSRLPEQSKNELLVSCFNAYSPVLTEKLNVEINRDSCGEYCHVGAASMEYDGEIILRLSRVKVDYRKLLNQEKVKCRMNDSLGRLAAVIRLLVNASSLTVPNKLEKLGLELLRDQKTKLQLQKLIGGILSKKGIQLTLSEIRIKQDTDKETAVKSVTKPAFTETAKADMICALAGYLKAANAA